MPESGPVCMAGGIESFREGHLADARYRPTNLPVHKRAPGRVLWPPSAVRFGGGRTMTNDAVKAPTAAQLKALAHDLGFGMGEAELAAFGELMGPSIDAYNAVDRMAQELPPVKYPR